MNAVQPAQESVPQNGTLTPVGFRLLIKVLPVQEKVGSVYMPEDRRKQEDVANVVAQVVAAGEMAYTDTNRFPKGPWCSVNDYIVVAPYSGQRIDVNGAEHRIINDDQVLGIVADPRSVGRAY